MKFLKAEEKRGRRPTLWFTQIGRVLCGGGTALQSSMNHPYILYNDINFLSLLVHVYTLWPTLDSHKDCCFEFGLHNYDTEFRSKINLISKTFCLLTLLSHSNRD